MTAGVSFSFVPCSHVIASPPASHMRENTLRKCTAFAAPHKTFLALQSLNLREVPKLRTSQKCRRVLRTVCSSHPDFDEDPQILPSAKPEQFVRVRVFSMGPPDSAAGATLLTLLPVEDVSKADGRYQSDAKPILSETAFRMSVSEHQAKAIRDLIVEDSDNDLSSCSNENLESKDKERKLSKRPTTHMLLQSILDAHNTSISEAAITHIASDVFIASIYLAPSGDTLAGNEKSERSSMPRCQKQMALDARPSDAIAIAAYAKAPLYLHRDLLRLWPVSITAIQLDAAAGLCEYLPPFGSQIDKIRYALQDKIMKSSEGRHAPQYVRLRNLCAQLDVAVRCERYQEAARLRDEIDCLCPIERLREALHVSLDDQRFLDAARLRDEIGKWERRLARWESSATDSDDDFERDYKDSLSWFTSRDGTSSLDVVYNDKQEHSCLSFPDSFFGQSTYYNLSADQFDVMDKSFYVQDGDIGEQEHNCGENGKDSETS